MLPLVTVSGYVIFWTVFTATFLHGIYRATRSRQPRAVMSPRAQPAPAAPWTPTVIDEETLARARYVDGRIEVDEFEARIGEILHRRGE